MLFFIWTNLIAKKHRKTMCQQKIGRLGSWFNKVHKSQKIRKVRYILNFSEIIIMMMIMVLFSSQIMFLNSTQKSNNVSIHALWKWLPFFLPISFKDILYKKELETLFSWQQKSKFSKRKNNGVIIIKLCSVCIRNLNNLNLIWF